VKADLQYILENEHFRICGLLTADRFVDYCIKRKIDISERELEKLEELKIFYPVARTTAWPYVAKIETVNEQGGYKSIGPLEESEHWVGETCPKYVQYDFGRTDTEKWLQEGRLWDPKTKPFAKWSTYHSHDGLGRMTSYYSQFQAYELWHRIKLLRCKIAAEYWVENPDKWAKSIQNWAIEMLEFAKQHFFRYDISLLSQILANRYYPFTQTNQRYFNLSAPYQWDWDDFCDKWNAHKVLKELSLETADIRKAWEMLVLDAKTCDPLEQWYDLVSFTAIEKRDKLKGHALRARTWYIMEHMLRLFYYDLTKEELPTPEGPVTYKFVPGVERPVTPNPLIHLEEIANDFNINPRPVLILLVEGEGEERYFPKLMENYFEVSCQSLGIQIISLNGVGNFCGNGAHDRHGAMIRFVDDYHSRGTIVFIIMDNENKAEKIRNDMLARKSIYEKRMLTREEYIVIWKKSFEFDNFENDEIAEAMSQLTDHRRRFTAEQIQEIKDKKCPKKGRRLEDLYKEVTNYSLEKPMLMEALVELICKEKTGNGCTEQRRIVSVLKHVIDLARENRPQSSQWHRDYRANTGLYGKVLDNESAGIDEGSDKGNTV
jgi:hypothetical protein